MESKLLKVVVFIVLLLSVSVSLPAVIKDKSGFYEIEPVNYYFHNGSHLSRIYHTSSRTRIFYSFLKADQNAIDKPLFVFFNGGPGSGTSCGLQGFYTGRKTLDNQIDGGGDSFINNPHSWTKMGNLLYIDARCTGFSYGLMEQNINRTFSGIWPEFNGRNFNSYIDAADFIRVLLKVLADRPSIKNNRVIIVGESYGGVRSTLMLHMLLNYRGYQDGSYIYQDPDLVERIYQHFSTIFPNSSSTGFDKETIVNQFGHQVLIQPAIDNYQQMEEVNFMEKKNSVIYEIASQEGKTFIPCTTSDCNRSQTIFNFITDVCGRDPYGCHKPNGWTGNFFLKASQLMQQSEDFQTITGYNPKSIPEMYADQRLLAYKSTNPGDGVNSVAGVINRYNLENLLTEKELYLINYHSRTILKQQHLSALSSDFDSIFGYLKSYDSFYVSLNGNANYAFHYYTASVNRNFGSYLYDYLTGEKFLENLVHVKTFITNAKYDLVIYTDALAKGLTHHTDIIENALHQKDDPRDRPGTIQVKYHSGKFGIKENNRIREIRFPYYTESSHPVSLTEPAEFYQDVFEWLNLN